MGAILAYETNTAGGGHHVRYWAAPVARVMAGVQTLLHRRGYLLALAAFDCASEWNTIPVQLNQRGIEGVVAIDAILPQELELPVASVELEYLTLPEPLDTETADVAVGVGGVGGRDGASTDREGSSSSSDESVAEAGK